MSFGWRATISPFAQRERPFIYERRLNAWKGAKQRRIAIHQCTEQVTINLLVSSVRSIWYGEELHQTKCGLEARANARALLSVWQLVAANDNRLAGKPAVSYELTLSVECR